MKHPKKKILIDLPFCPIALRIIEKPLDKTLKPEKQTAVLSLRCVV